MSGGDETRERLSLSGSGSLFKDKLCLRKVAPVCAWLGLRWGPEAIPGATNPGKAKST